MTNKKVLQQALDALYPISHNSTDDPRGQADKAITAIKEALTQPETGMLHIDRLDKWLDASLKERKAQLVQTDGRSFAEVHPRNLAAKCKCEHWQSCVDCHPTAHTPEPFKPDWGTEAVLVEEMQRMAKQIEDWEAVAADQAMTIAMMRSGQGKPYADKALLSNDRMTIDSETGNVSIGSSPLQRQPLTEERNFCPRCGKRLASGFTEISIHTCTPPKDAK